MRVTVDRKPLLSSCPEEFHDGEGDVHCTVECSCVLTTGASEYKRNSIINDGP